MHWTSPPMTSTCTATTSAADSAASFNPTTGASRRPRSPRKTGRPVKFMLTRDQELKIAGNRPSGFIDVKLGADENGVVQVWDSHHWGTSGFNGSTVSVGNFPYVFRPKNYRRKATGIITDNEPSVAWRAPNHPQACAITQTAYDDLAAKMQADSLDIFLRNLENIDSPEKASVYAEQLRIAADLIGLAQALASARQRQKAGSVVEGLGIGIHKWGWHRQQLELLAEDPSRRWRRVLLRHARLGNRHPHRLCDGLGRDVRAADRSGQSQHRQLDVSLQRCFGRQHHGGSRQRVASSCRAGCVGSDF